MKTPIPSPFGQNAEAVKHAAKACADALSKNSNPYREQRTDVDQLVPRLIELHQGEAGPERPTTIDPFSALVGAAMALGITLCNGDTTAWITSEGKDG